MFTKRLLMILIVVLLVSPLVMALSETPVKEPLEIATTEHTTTVVETTVVPTTEKVTTTEPTTTTQPTTKAKSTTARFKLTAYCACAKCCGKTDGITASGTKATQGRTIAVDPRVIPYGTKVIINGNTYIAEDCGGAIKENRIDVYFNSHSEALKFGVQYADVTILWS